MAEGSKTSGLDLGGLDKLARHLGQLAGLIDEELDFQETWFSNPGEYLERIPTNPIQRNAIQALLCDIWPEDRVCKSPPVLGDDGKPDETLLWLEVPGRRAEKTEDARKRPTDGWPTALYVVSGKTAAEVAVGIGITYRYNPEMTEVRIPKRSETAGLDAAKKAAKGEAKRLAKKWVANQFVIQPFAYFPLVGMPVEDPRNYLALGTTSNPLHLGLDIHFKAKSKLEALSWNGLRLISTQVFRPKAKRPTFRAFGKKKGETDFELLHAPDLRLILNALLAIPEIRQWLEDLLPELPDLDLFAWLEQLDFELPEFEFPDLRLDLSPEEWLAQFSDWLRSLLPEIPELEFPDITLTWLLNALLHLNLPPLGLPGLPNLDFCLDLRREIGFRFRIRDTELSSKSSKKKRTTRKISLQLGETLGLEGEQSWLGKDVPPGVAVRIGRIVGEGDSVSFAFEPSLELASVGLDVEGTAEAPLANVKGVRLEGVRPRLYLQLDEHGIERWGVAANFQKIGIPLGPPAGKGNPVAKNLLSSGGSGAGASQPVNPTFSATIGYRGELFGRVEGDQSTDGKVWLPVQRAFGPLFCRRIGFGFETDEPPRLLVAYDGKVSVGPLGLDLVDLSVGVPVKNPTEIDDYSLDLDGINIAFDQQPVSVSGGLYKSVDPATNLIEYAGSAVISAKAMTISGFGVFGSVGGDPSFFLFAMLQRELGGPPFFHVTGVAAGFGYNRGLILPALGDVEHFPLVKGVLEDDYFGDSEDPKQALQVLRDYLPARRGEYWFAAGVRFSSFETIESVAILSVAFGSQTVISVLGVSTLTIPKGAGKNDAVAYARLLLKAELVPSAGTLKVEGRLSDDSFIFSGNCRLTGGFAFYTWFAGEHDGDFVITVGGYHPRFEPPAHYPAVERVGIDWPINSDLRVTGELYFALTPSCLMAGGALAARFESGGLKAWFDAYAHFLMYWEPFHYEIDIGVRIGASYTFKINLLFTTIRITIEIELSAQLSLWGPPFAGRATLSWGPLDFTLTFGPQTKAVAALAWSTPQKDGFRDKMLPPQPISIDITGGLLRQDRIEVPGRPQKVTWPVINAHQLRVTTRSVVPSTEMRMNQTEVPNSAPEHALGIWPMKRSRLESTLHVKVCKHGSEKPLSREEASFTTTVLRQAVPYAMWSPDDWTGLEPSADVIEGAPAGLGLRLVIREPTHELPPVKLWKLQYERIDKKIGWSERVVEATPIDAPVNETLMNTIWDREVEQDKDEKGAVDKRRRGIRAALQGVTPFELNEVKLETLAKTADQVLQAMPSMGRVGQPWG